MKRLLRADQTLFRDPDVFDFASMPDHHHHRDAQVKELAFLLRGAVLRGPPGLFRVQGGDPAGRPGLRQLPAPLLRREGGDLPVSGKE